MTSRARHLVVLLLLAASAIPAGAGQSPSLSEAEIEQRLAFIEARLNEGRTSARAWQYGWSGFFAANMGLQGYLAAKSNSGDNVTYHTVSAAKSAMALALMLLRPLPAVKGAAPTEAMASDTPALKLARLKAAEDLLRTNATRAQERKSWARHLTAIAVHLIGGTAIATVGDVKDAAVSNLTGIALSQVHIWSQPYRAIDDLTDYERTFPEKPLPGALTWELTPMPGGMGVRIHF